MRVSTRKKKKTLLFVRINTYRTYRHSSMYVSLINTLFKKQEFAYILSMVSVAYIYSGEKIQISCFRNWDYFLKLSSWARVYCWQLVKVRIRWRGINFICLKCLVNILNYFLTKPLLYLLKIFISNTFNFFHTYLNLLFFRKIFLNLFNVMIYSSWKCCIHSHHTTNLHDYGCMFQVPSCVCDL